MTEHKKPSRRRKPETQAIRKTIERHTRGRGFPKGEKQPVTTPESTRARKLRALELRIAGYRHWEIRDQLIKEGHLGTSIPTVSRDIRKMVARLERQEYRLASRLKMLELARLDAQTKALWNRREVPDVARTLVQIAQRRAKLAGLDEAIEITDPGLNGEAALLAKLSDKTVALIVAELEAATGDEIPPS